MPNALSLWQRTYYKTVFAWCHCVNIMQTLRPGEPVSNVPRGLEGRRVRWQRGGVRRGRAPSPLLPRHFPRARTYPYHAPHHAPACASAATARSYSTLLGVSYRSHDTDVYARFYFSFNIDITFYFDIYIKLYFINKSVLFFSLSNMKCNSSLGVVVGRFVINNLCFDKFRGLQLI